MSPTRAKAVRCICQPPRLAPTAVLVPRAVEGESADFDGIRPWKRRWETWELMPHFRTVEPPGPGPHATHGGLATWTALPFPYAAQRNLPAPGPGPGGSSAT